MRRLLLGVMVVTLMSVAAAPAAVAQETHKIGAVLSVTGPASYIGEDERNTLLLLQDQVNARVGIGGKKVDIVNYVAAAGIYTMSPTDHNGVQIESMPMLVVEKGAFKLVNR